MVVVGCSSSCQLKRSGVHWKEPRVKSNYGLNKSLTSQIGSLHLSFLITPQLSYSPGIANQGGRQALG